MTREAIVSCLRHPLAFLGGLWRGFAGAFAREMAREIFRLEQARDEEQRWQKHQRIRHIHNNETVPCWHTRDEVLNEWGQP